MKTQDHNSPHPLTWITGIAIILFCTTGIAALAGLFPNSLSCPGMEFINADPPRAGAAATQAGAATGQPGAARFARTGAPPAS